MKTLLLEHVYVLIVSPRSPEERGWQRPM